MPETVVWPNSEVIITEKVPSDGGIVHAQEQLLDPADQQPMAEPVDELYAVDDAV